MKTMDRTILAAAALLACAAFAGPAAADEPADQMPSSEQPSSQQPSSQQPASSVNGPRDAQSVVASWPDKTKAAALALIEKYGPPDGVMDKMLVWNDKAQFQMVGVFRDAVPHNDPTAHEDFIENKISYKVPENKVAALARFDHSLVIDQTRGTLASNCSSEQNNVLALNLANEIVTGKRDVASAKSFLKKTVKETMAGKSSPYTDSLMFTPGPGPKPDQGVEQETQPGAEQETQP